MTLSDSDLAGAGTVTVAVFSTTEGTPETLSLGESPPGSARFTGSIVATSAPPSASDGMISVVDRDTIHVRYIDASACGPPDVPVETTADVDCVTPALSNVDWVVVGTRATIDWQTSEAATSIVHYGMSVPTGSSESAAGRTTTHAVTLDGLTECTTYYFWLESADAAGNIAASNRGGGYFAFTTGRDVVRSYDSTDTPIAIPDNDANGATSTIVVPDAQPVQDVNATVNITHTYDGDLSLSLLTPSGTTILLSTRRGGSGDDFTGTVFGDEAATPISSGIAPFSGSYRPESPLSAADGASPSGSWRFKTVDQASVDVGTINSWTLTLSLPSEACASTGPPPPVSEGTTGPAFTASRGDASGSLLHLSWDDATCPAKNYHLVYGALSELPTYTLAGGVCGLGPLGAYDREGVPTGDLWFVVDDDDADAAEGSWGELTPQADRNGMVASGACHFTSRTNEGTCR